MIKFDNVSWYVDALLEAAILISFVVATMLEGTAYAEWAAYIDPIVLIVLAVQMLPSAIHHCTIYEDKSWGGHHLHYIMKYKKLWIVLWRNIISKIM